MSVIKILINPLDIVVMKEKKTGLQNGIKIETHLAPSPSLWETNTVASSLSALC